MEEPSCSPSEDTKIPVDELQEAKKDPEDSPCLLDSSLLFVSHHKTAKNPKDDIHEATKSPKVKSCKSAKSPSCEPQKTIIRTRCASCIAIKNMKYRMIKSVKSKPQSANCVKAHNHVRGLGGGVSYGVMKKLEAAGFLKKNDHVNAARHLADAHAVTLTKRALVAYQTSSQPLGKKIESSVFDKQAELLQHHSTRSDVRDTLRILPDNQLLEEHCKRLQQSGNTLKPLDGKWSGFGKLNSDWTVVQLTTCPRKTSFFPSRMKGDVKESEGTPALFLTHGKCGVNCDVYVVQVPSPKSNTSIVRELQDLLKEHQMLNTNYVGTKKKYWEAREMHSSKMKDLVRKMEKEWLREKKCLLLGRLEDPSAEADVEKFVAATEKRLNLKLSSHNKFLLTKLIESCCNMSVEEIMRSVLHILDNNNMEEKILEAAPAKTHPEEEITHEFSKLTINAEEQLLSSFKQLKIKDKQEKHIETITLDSDSEKETRNEAADLVIVHKKMKPKQCKEKERQMEKKSCVFDRDSEETAMKKKLKEAVSFLLSNVYLLMQFKNAKRHPVILIVDNEIQILPWEVLPIMCHQPVSRVSSLGILAVLYETHMSTTGQKEVDPVKSFYVLNPDGNLLGVQQRLESYLSKTFNEQGIVGKSPSPEEFIGALQRNDLVVYCGHGSGSKYIPNRVMQRIQCQAATLLLGCRSAQLKEQGQHLDPTGAVHQYIIASSPCIMGMLWDVTDRDCDRVTLDLLKKWLPGQEQEEKEFLKAVMLCRKAALQFLTAAAVVVYGLPVEIKKTAWLEN